MIFYRSSLVASQATQLENTFIQIDERRKKYKILLKNTYKHEKVSKLYTQKQHTFRKYKISGFKLNQALKFNDIKRRKKTTKLNSNSEHVNIIEGSEVRRRSTVQHTLGNETVLNGSKARRSRLVLKYRCIIT